MKNNNGKGLRHMGQIPGREDNLMYRMTDGFNLDRTKAFQNESVFYSKKELRPFCKANGNSTSLERSVQNAISSINNPLISKLSVRTLEEKILSDFYKPSKREDATNLYVGENDSDY